MSSLTFFLFSFRAQDLLQNGRVIGSKTGGVLGVSFPGSSWDSISVPRSPAWSSCSVKKSVGMS